MVCPRGISKRHGRFSGSPTEIQAVVISVTDTLEQQIFVHGEFIVGLEVDHYSYQTMDDIPELSGDEDIPAGDRYPLNSRRLRAVWIQRIAQSLDVLTSALTAGVRQMIDGKLADLQQEATNVQVIVQGKCDGAAMFLVNENSIILFINAHHTPQTHVTSHSESSSAPLRVSPEGNDD